VKDNGSDWDARDERAGRPAIDAARTRDSTATNSLELDTFD